jgi:hypothetical protein
MNVGELARAVDIWKLAERDPGFKEVYISGKTLRLVSVHSEAVTRFKGDALEKSVSISPVHLAGVLALMDQDAELSLEVAKASLVLRAGDRRAVLAVRNIPAPPSKLPKVESDPVDTAKLRDALPFLAGCVSQGVIRPALTGICCSAKGKVLKLTATNGETLWAEARIPNIFREDIEELIIPAGDLSIALGLLGEEVAIQHSGNSLLLKDKQTLIKLSLLHGPYPSGTWLTPLKDYTSSITFGQDVLGDAVKAAILLDSDRIVSFVVRNGRGAWVIKGQELGGFRVSAGDHEVEDITFYFDAHWIEPAVGLGAEITMHYLAHDKPVLFIGAETKYRLWMPPITR